MIRTSLTSILLICGGLVFSQTKVFEGKAVESASDYNELKEYISNFTIYEIDASAMHQYLSSAGSFPKIKLSLSNTIEFNLDLRINNIFKEGMKPRIATENGVVYGEIPKIKCYQGQLHGSSQRVTLSVNTDFLSGFITDKNDFLYFEPLRFLIPGSPDNYFIFYHSKDYIEKAKLSCASLESDKFKQKVDAKIKQQKSNPESSLMVCKEVEIGEASDKMMCNHYGSIAAVQNRITAVINDVQSNYCCDFDDELSLIISDWYNVDCNGTDPWSNTVDPYQLINEFTTWGPGGFSFHDIGELFTYRVFNPNLLGLAWNASVCYDLRYNVVRDWSNNADLMRVTIAHEMGHNFGCDHDPAGSPTIMAPNVNNTNTWSDESIATFNYAVPYYPCLSGCSGNFPPVADFIASNTTGCKPFTVNFTDLSTYDPTSWLWTFPGGTPSSSTAKNPTVVYSTVGSYSVTLTAGNPYGSNTITKPGYITVLDKPVADFNYTKSEGNVHFNNTSSGLGNSHWDFGDGNFSTEKNPVHDYPVPGTYVVKLTVTNLCGTSTKTENITIVFLPIALFSSDVNSGCVTLSVNFMDESLNTPTSWNWTFTGGFPPSSTLKNPTVSYSNPGEYKVSLVATNSEGSGSVVKDKYIKVNVLPSPAFTYTSIGNKINFLNITPGINNTFLWDFGDGNSSTEVSPMHSYAQAGTYLVKLIVNNICGTNNIIKSVSTQLIPDAKFTADTLIGCVPFMVHFADTSANNPDKWLWIFEGGIADSTTVKNPAVLYSNPGYHTVTLIASNSTGSDTIIKAAYIKALSTPIAGYSETINGNIVSFINNSIYGISYLWNFGDGTTSTEANPVHIYAQEKTYNVSLIAQNPCGSDTIIQTVVIIFPPTAGFSADVSSGCVAFTVHFTNNSSINSTYYKWILPGATPDSSNEKNPSVVYNIPGSYNVSLIAGNPGGSDTISFMNFITAMTTPAASFNYTNNNFKTSFINTSANGSNYLWLFGDGDSSVIKNPVHNYALQGSYIVHLWVTNACGTTKLTDTIEVVFPPKANFTSNNNSACNNLTVNFQDLSGPGTTQWHWIFPGGNPDTSNQQNPIVNYANIGQYDVSLIATNSGGSDTILKPAYILISAAPPVAQFSYTNFGLSYSFINQSTDAGNYLWDFGDGNTSLELNPEHSYIAGGSFIVKMIAFNGCGSDTIEYEIKVVGTPPAALFGSNVTEGCLPLVVSFKDKSLGGANNWLWTFPGGDPNSSTDQNPVVFYNTAGKFDVELIAMNSFGNDTINLPLYIIVKGVPVAQFSYTLQGNIVKFINSSFGGLTYLWNFGDGSISNEENPNHAYTSSGKYTVTLTVSNECGSFSFTQNIDIKVSTQEISFIEAFSIYPNPNNGIFNLLIKSKQKTSLKLTMVDMSGKEIYKQNYDIIEGTNLKEVKLNGISAGQYNVIISSENDIAVEKIIIEK